MELGGFRNRSRTFNFGIFYIVTMFGIHSYTAELSSGQGDVGELMSTARILAGIDGVMSRRSVRSVGEREPGLSMNERVEAVTEHNRWRRLVDASDMEFIIYNDYLADMIQETINTCIMEHHFPDRDPSEMPYRELGQNLYANNWQPLNVTYDIKRWYDEGVWYDIDTDTCSGPQCGHYTQLVWGPSREIGCGYKLCPNVSDWNGKVKLNNAHFFGCNYGPAGNYDHRSPYFVGSACSRCSSGTFWCDTEEPRGLCRSDLVFGNTSVDLVCGGICDNRGAPLCDCTCSCPAGFYGKYCEKPCVDTHRWCGTGYPRYACWDADSGSYIRSVCPALCSQCVAAPAGGAIVYPTPCPAFVQTTSTVSELATETEVGTTEPASTSEALTAAPSAGTENLTSALWSVKSTVGMYNISSPSTATEIMEHTSATPTGYYDNGVLLLLVGALNKWAEAMVTLKRLITEEINNYCRLQPSQCCPANSYPTSTSQLSQKIQYINTSEVDLSDYDVTRYHGVRLEVNPSPKNSLCLPGDYEDIDLSQSTLLTIVIDSKAEFSQELTTCCGLKLVDAILPPAAPPTPTPTTALPVKQMPVWAIVVIAIATALVVGVIALLAYKCYKGHKTVPAGMNPVESVLMGDKQVTSTPV